MRIMTNYLQVITSAISFNLRYPGYLLDAFAPVEKVGASSETVLSFDCMISDYNTTTSSTSFFKILLTALLPIPLLIFFAILWTIMKRCFSRFNDIKRNIIVS
jgi:hypothetical protein